MDHLHKPNSFLLKTETHSPHGAGGGGGGGGVAGPIPLVLIGGGGHGLVVLEAAQLAEMPVAGYLDDNPAALVSAILIDLPHPFPTPPNLGALGDHDALTGRHWILSVGDLAHRRKLISGYLRRAEVARAARSVIHPTAFVSPSALIGPGVFVGPRAVVHARARVGAHGIVNSAAIIEHDCTLEENVHVGPGAALGGAVHVGRDSLVGLGARVLPGVQIGIGCTVAAGAVVLGNVPDGATVAGVPARGV